MPLLQTSDIPRVILGYFTFLNLTFSPRSTKGLLLSFFKKIRDWTSAGDWKFTFRSSLRDFPATTKFRFTVPLSRSARFQRRWRRVERFLKPLAFRKPSSCYFPSFARCTWSCSKRLQPQRRAWRSAGSIKHAVTPRRSEIFAGSGPRKICVFLSLVRFMPRFIAREVGRPLITLLENVWINSSERQRFRYRNFFICNSFQLGWDSTLHSADSTVSTFLSQLRR